LHPHRGRRGRGIDGRVAAVAEDAGSYDKTDDGG